MGLIRLVLCTVPAILLLTSKQCAKAVGYIAVFSAFMLFKFMFYRTLREY